MKFLCERCGTRYSIADDKVRQKILKIRCKSCDNVITLRDSAVPQEAVAAVSVPNPRPAVPSGVTRSLPPPPKPVAAPVERSEWHLAVDGQQKGPFTKTQLATAVLGQKPGAEVFIWKDGLDGWKEPNTVPEIERALAQAKSGRSAPPPRVPTSSSLPAKPLAALQAAARSPASGAMAARASAGDHLSAFDEGEATQIQPLSAALMADLESEHGAAKDDDDKTPVGNLAVNGEERLNGAHAKGAGHSGGVFAPSARAPLDLFSDASSAPFFPPPAAQVQTPNRQVGPAPFGPHSSMGAGESGLSKVMSLGGRVSRKPWLKYGAAAVAVLFIFGAMVMAYIGGGSPGTAVFGAKHPTPGAGTGTQTPEQLEKAAADEARKWFPDQTGEGKVAHVTGPAAVQSGKKPVAGGKPIAANPLAPPPLTPPPVGALDVPATGTQERKVDLGLAERRALPNRKAQSSAPAVDQASIGNVVRRKENQDAVKLCYNRVLRRSGVQTGGRIEVVVNIGISGKVKSVALASPPALNAVHDCLKQAVNRWHFPVSPEDYETGFTLVLSGS